MYLLTRPTRSSVKGQSDSSIRYVRLAEGGPICGNVRIDKCNLQLGRLGRDLNQFIHMANSRSCHCDNVLVESSLSR